MTYRTIAALAGIALPTMAALAAPINLTIENKVVTGSTTEPTTGTITVTFSGAAGSTLGGYDLDVWVRNPTMTSTPLTFTGFTPAAPFDNVDTLVFEDYGGGEYLGTVVFNNPSAPMTESSVVGSFTYSIPANTFGLFPVEWDTIGPYSSAQNGARELFDLSLTNGSINVVVPEPASLALLAGAGLFAATRRRRA